MTIRLQFNEVSRYIDRRFAIKMSEKSFTSRRGGSMNVVDGANKVVDLAQELKDLLHDLADGGVDLLQDVINDADNVLDKVIDTGQEVASGHE